MHQDAVKDLMKLYPRIYFACHTRHVHDPKSRRVLSAHQASILDHLDDREPLSLLDLAAHMGVTPSTMSLHVERLVRQGYIRRDRDASDGRRLNLRITSAGLCVREANSVLDEKRVRSMLARLTSDEKVAGIRGLAVLARAANEQVAQQAHHKRLRRGRLPV